MNNLISIPDKCSKAWWKARGGGWVQRFICAEEIVGLQECFLDVYKSCRVLPSAEPMLTVDGFAHTGIVGTVGGSEANSKKAEHKEGSYWHSLGE